MKSIILLFFIGFTSMSLYGQKFFFPRENYSDSIVLAKALPKLARQIQNSILSSNEPLSMSSNMNLSLLVGEYRAAVAYVDSMRLPFEEDYKNGVYVPFEVFAKAKEEQPTNASFLNEFEKRFRETYTGLNVASQEIAEANARIPVGNLKKSLDAIVARQKASDTLQLRSALQLISSYNWYRVYNQTSLVMRQVVGSYNENHYQIETAVVETRDGNKLRAHVVRKKGLTEQLPTVFIFNIYADSLRDIGKAKYYAAAGYACVVANTRGKGIDEHEIAPFEYDGKDAYDIIDWISKQNWSNGDVGMVGGSYNGFTQWGTAKQLHPSLKTIMPQVAVGPGIDYPMNGNVFMSYMLRWIRYVTNNRTTDYASFSNTGKWDALYKTWYEQGLSFRSLDSLEGQPSNIFQRWLDHPSYGAFWQNMVPYKSDFSNINIPILTTTGYFDDDQMGALYYYKQHHIHNPNANHYLVIGPYTHGGAQLYPQKAVGGYQVDSVATSFNFRNLSVEWFDYVLKKGNKPEILRDKVNYQLMGTNQWQHASALDGMATDTLTFYFSNAKSNDAYTLSSHPNAGYVEQEVDLADRSDATEFEFKVIRDSINTDLNTSVSFISAPFEEPTIWSGSFIASLRVAINKKDFDMVIRAYELMPDGRYFALFTESGFSALQRASYANDRAQRQLLTPGEKETVEIKTSCITAKQMSKGSRLVITLGINKSPYWQINYGTGKDVSEETIEDAIEPLVIKWYGDSFIQIPMLKAME